MKFILLKENLQQARKILRDKGISEDSPEFEELRELLSKNLGYIGFFSYLKFVKRIEQNRLVGLYNNIIEHKNLLNRLPKQVTQYKDIEKLEDDLNILSEWVKYNREFVSKLKGSIKQKARDDKEMKDSFTNMDYVVRKDVIDNFLPKIAKYRNYEDFKEDLINYVHKNRDPKQVIESVSKLPNSNIVYNKDGILVAEIFSKEDSCEVGSKSWCISDSKSNYWNTYAGVKTGNKQYFIWNFNIPFTSNESMVGVTIDEDGKARNTHYKNDNRADFNSYISRNNIPKEIFKPLGKSDIPKLLKANGGLSEKIYNILHKFDAFDEFLDQIPFEDKLTYGLEIDDSKLTDEQRNNDTYKLLYKSEIDSNIIKSFKTLQNHGVDDLSDIDINNINSTTLFVKLVMYDKDIINLETFIESLKLNPNEETKIEESRYNYNLVIKCDISELTDYFSNGEEEFIRELSHSGGYGNSLSDQIDAHSELDYIDRYLSYEFMEVFEKLVRSVNYLPKNIIDELILSIKDNDGDIRNVIGEIESATLGKFDLEDDFISYIHDLCNSAEKYLNQDKTQFEKDILGEYDPNIDEWEIDPTKLLEKLRSSEKKSFMTLSEWLENSPLDFSYSAYNFGDTVSGYDYLNCLTEDDFREQSEFYINKFNEYISEIEDDEDFNILSKFVSYYEKSGYEVRSYDSTNSYNSDRVFYLVKDLDTEGGEVEIKEKYLEGGDGFSGGTRMVKKKLFGLIPFNRIDLDTMDYHYIRLNVNPDIINGLYMFTTKEWNKNGTSSKLLSIQTREISFDKDRLEDFVDPNQLEIQFEKRIINSFSHFQQIRNKGV